MQFFRTANAVTGEILTRLSVGANVFVVTPGIQQEKPRMKFMKNEDVSVASVFVSVSVSISIWCDREPGILLPLSSRACA